MWRWLVVGLLALSQLPMLAGLLLGVFNAGSDHQFRVGMNHGRVSVTLHHFKPGGGAHQHTALERLLALRQGGEHPDHGWTFGSDTPAERLADDLSAEEREGPAPALLAVAADLPSVRRVELRDLLAGRGDPWGRSGDLPPPGVDRRGTVMRL